MKKHLRIISVLITCLIVTSIVLSSCSSSETGVKVTGVSISGTGVHDGVLNLQIGQRDIPLSASVRPSNADDKSVTWMSEDENVVTVSETGVLSIVGEGTTKVTAKSGEVSDSITVTVSAAVEVESVRFNQEVYTCVVPTNDTGTLDLSGEVIVGPADATDKTIVWSVEPADDLVVINAQGMIIVSSAVNIDTEYTITASSSADPSKSASAVLKLSHNEATGVVVRLSSNGAQKPASYVYEFSLDDRQFEKLYFVADPRPVGAAGSCVFKSENPEICDVVMVDEKGQTVGSSTQAYLDIKTEGETKITVSLAGTDVSKDILVRINPPAGYIFKDLNVLPDEISDDIDTSNWWDFNANPTPKTDSLFFSVQEPTNNLTLLGKDLDGTSWRSKMNPNQGNGAYVEDGGFCIVYTPWDWPLDNEQTNCYIYNTVHTPSGATAFRSQLRSQAGAYTAGVAKFRIRMADKNDLTNYIFLDVNGQRSAGFNAMPDRPIDDKASYENGAFDPQTGWIIIPGVTDFNIGEDYFYSTIPEEWRDRDVVIFIECDAMYEDDGFGHMIEGKCNQMLVCSLGFVSNANDPEEFAKH